MEERKPTFSILGCCVARDTFSFARPNEYKVEQCETTISPLSMMAPPPENGVLLEEADFKKPDGTPREGCTSNYWIRCFCLDANKKVFDFMKQKISDWLVIDFESLRNSVVTFKNGICVSRGGAFLGVRRVALKRFGEPVKTKSVSDTSKEERISAINSFIDEVLKMYPANKIILNCCRGSDDTFVNAGGGMAE